jgi:tRNA G18 (ribose-2'-O)-methylase SpoU
LRKAIEEPMPIIPIDSLDDPRIAPYRNLKDKELARDGGRFIAEGEQVVRRLLKSQIPAQSLLIARRKCEAIAPLAPPNLPVFCAGDNLIARIMGFEFHSGVIGCGIRPTSASLPELTKPN